ncbi:MAG: glucodextranase DOMON-like domain-containing protein [Sulfolobales archaeon]
MSYVRVADNVYVKSVFAVLLFAMMLLSICDCFKLAFAVSGSSEVSYEDPDNDSYGPGDYVYSSAFYDAYRAEYFDLRRFSAKLDGGIIKLTLSFTNLSNPLRSPLGFSPQIVHVYIVGACDNGRTDTLGLNVRLRAIDAWCACVVVAPNLGDYVSSVVYVDGRTQAVDRVYVLNNSIVVEIPTTIIAEAVDNINVTAWRYFIAVSAYDPSSRDKLVRIGAIGSDAPVIYNKTVDELNLRYIPRVLDILAESIEDQLLTLNTYSTTHGDIATVAAYPYVKGTVLPSKPVIEVVTITTTRAITETYVKAYYLPGVTTTVTEYVQVPKYGVELYSLALISVALVVILAATLSKRKFLSKLS